MKDKFLDFFYEHWRGFISFCLFLLCLVPVLFGFLDYQNFQADSAQRRAKYDTLKEEGESVTASSSADDETDDEADAVNATAAGGRAANLQNSYLMLVNATAEEEEMDERDKQALDSVSSELAVLFPSDKAMTAAWLADSSSSCSWQFWTNYNLSKTDAKVVWIYGNGQLDGSKNDVFAYATAVYDGETNTFSDAKVFETAYGKQQMTPASPDSDAEVDPYEATLPELFETSPVEDQPAEEAVNSGSEAVVSGSGNAVVSTSGQ